MNAVREKKRTVRKDDGLELDFRIRRVAILACKHVNFALVHTELANVGLQSNRRGKARWYGWWAAAGSMRSNRAVAA